MRYALIDESGRLHDPRDRILVISAVVAPTLVGLDKIITKARERIPAKGKRRRERLSEIKFSFCGDKTRKFVLGELVQKDIKIYSIIIDKQGRKIIDSPKNFSLVISKVLEKPLKDNPGLNHILIDRHFTFTTQRERFNDFLRGEVRREVFVEHLDSLQNPVISLADFVASAVRYHYVRGDKRFADIIGEKVVEEKFFTWKQIKSHSQQKSGIT